MAAALSPFLTGPDQVVAVAMSQDNWQIVAAHLGILKAGGTVMFLDTTLPDGLITHMLNDAQPVVILTRGQDKFRDLPTLDVLTLPKDAPKTAALAGRSYAAPRDHLLHERHQRDAQGRRVPARGLREPGPELRRLLRSPSRHGATSLTSSLGYDGSIPETYSAWVSGCAVPPTKEQIRSGPDLVPVLREAEVTVLFCPPALLTTLTRTPN